MIEAWGGYSLSAVLIRPAPPLLGDVVLCVERCIVRREAFVLGLSAASTRCHRGDIDVSDEIEQAVRKVPGFLPVPSSRDQAADRRFLLSGVRVQDRIGRDVAAVVRERRAVHRRIPVPALPARDSSGEDAGEVIVVGEVAEPEHVLVLVYEIGVAVRRFTLRQEVIEYVCELLCSSDAVPRTVLPDRLVVLPVVVDCLCDSGGRDGSKEYVWIEHSQERDKGSRVRSAVRDVRDIGGSQVLVFQALKDDMLSKVSRVSQGLLRGQEAEVLCQQIAGGEALAVVAMLQDDPDTVGRLRELRENTLLEIG